MCTGVPTGLNRHAARADLRVTRPRLAVLRAVRRHPHADTGTVLAAAADLEVERTAAVVFEDALAGVQAGRAGGFGAVIGVDRLDQAAALREHGADVVVTDLADLLERS